MPRICFVMVAGLDRTLLGGGGAKALSAYAHQVPYEPAFPAVTCTAQATLTTGADAGGHGIICNGLYTHGSAELQKHLDISRNDAESPAVGCWHSGEQSGTLLNKPRFWEGLNKKVAMLFWREFFAAAPASKFADGHPSRPKPVHYGRWQ